MNDDIAKALEIGPASSARERTIDITTTGRRSGQPRRIEIWFYRFEDRIYLSGMPGLPPRRAWLSNLEAHADFTFHLKHRVQADLPARARIVTDPDERRRAFTHFVDDLNQPHNPGRIQQPTSVEEWERGSPLVHVIFEDSPS